MMSLSRIMNRWWVLTFLVFGPLFARAAEPGLRLERQPVAGGAELLTVFGSFPESKEEIPLVSVLRDTLGDRDPENDRLRYVWILTSARPTLLQHAAAFIPFFYFRPDLGKNADRKPASVLDMADTRRAVWSTLAGSIAQVAALDSNGALIRASTRRYRGNLSDQRQVRLIEGFSVLSQLEDIPEVKTILSEPELLEIEARLSLAEQTLGGLVTADGLPSAYFKNRVRTEEVRGHNWELLRQHAEANGLYFEPLGAGRSSAHALLWVAKDDLDDPSRPFDAHLLNIADPYTDSRLKKWTGFTMTRDGQEMIPLALYSLEYPKVPLLLVDFRNTHAPKRREMFRMAITDTLSGVLGISKWGNWPYMAGSMAFDFIRSRHGDANNRVARLRSYSQVRQLLALDHSIDSNLRAELLSRLEMLGVNPLEQNVFAEGDIARRQYAALLRYAADPRGLPARLQKDRNTEVTDYQHRPVARAGLHLATWFSLGIYSPKERPEPELAAALDRERRMDHQLRFLETVADSSPQTEVVWNMDEVRRALDELAASGMPERAAQTIERILHQTDDAETRALCERALHSLGAAGQ
jgi:hypothetical protein